MKQGYLLKRNKKIANIQDYTDFSIYVNNISMILKNIKAPYILHHDQKPETDENYLQMNRLKINKLFNLNCRKKYAKCNY